MKDEWQMSPAEAALFRAVQDYFNAKSECATAENDCDGTWGYYGRDHEKAVDDAWDKVKIAASL